ncbi:MAG: methyl-accepting chemotaxis protein [Thermanaeromonas sp.]|uniref:methyl-accepting chemotaxis protein n=1 Tax=Thermanaeromonas sp. TaxID=2003697 RepID=UPI00243C3F2F|nr:methyl-accepting chemotaxis protein [Thermanaeromonas sp.]MCG0278998.1 methyl-accepting chemotaxis protein [Thermanaeromonas sp.]
MRETQSRALMDCFIAVAPYINQLVAGDVAVAVCDRERYLCYVPGKKINHRVTVGDPVKEGTLVWEAMQKGEPVSKRVGRELFGFPYLGIALPIKERGMVIGGVVFMESTERQELLLDLASRLSKISREVNAAVQQIFAEAQNLTGIGEELHSISSATAGRAKETSSIINFVKKIAQRSKILGLNASIEAARIGRHGGGFAVVAEEIRKMAEESSKAVERIERLLQELSQRVGTVELQASTIRNILSAQVEALQRIVGLVEEMDAVSACLQGEAEKLGGLQIE